MPLFIYEDLVEKNVKIGFFLYKKKNYGSR